MKALIDRIFRRYGTQITLRRWSGDVILQGFLRQTGSLSRQNMETVQSPVGQIPWSQYTLYLPAEPVLEAEDIFLVGDTWYTLRRVEPVYFREEVLYYWGLCERRGDTDTWGSQS